MRHLLTLDDLSSQDIDDLLGRASQIEEGSPVGTSSFDAALLFLDPSLRTRTGFHVAAGRLGGRVVDVIAARWQQGMSAAERFEDTLRAVTGIVDVAVVRASVDLEAHAAAGWASAPLVNGGDLHHHPTQALIDLYAIEARCGPMHELDVVVVGDLGMRATSSLLALLRRRPPARLRCVAPTTRLGETSAINGVEQCSSLLEVDRADVVYVGGLPAGEGADHLGDDERSAFRIDGGHLDRWGSAVSVFSPMPVIDEIAVGLRRDDRVRMYEQSDHGAAVRMAVLELVLGRHVTP